MHVGLVVLHLMQANDSIPCGYTKNNELSFAKTLLVLFNGWLLNFMTVNPYV